MIQDDRTEAQKSTHVWGVVGTDRFMSGWGEASGGMSYAVWACDSEGSTLRDLEYKVEQRGDMDRVRIVYLPDYRPRAAHTHIYVHTKSHPAFV